MKIAYIDAAIARGAAFLAQEQRPDGGIPGYYRDPGADPFPCTDIFPATILAHALAFVPEAAEVREKAVDFLVAEVTHEGLWNFLPRSAPQRSWFPDDVDDTVCATSALRAAGRPVPQNELLLMANRNREGLFHTWFAANQRRAGWRILSPLRKCSRRARQLLRRPSPWNVDRFFDDTGASPHDVDGVVNANALFHLGRRNETEPIISYLESILRAGDEAHCDKWYRNRFTVLYFFARALVPLSEKAADLLRARLAAAAPETPMEHASALCAQDQCGLDPDPELVRALLATQSESGSWPAEPIYWGDDRYWAADAVTTALALEALARCRSAGITLSAI